MADPIKLPPLPSRPIGMSVNDHIRARDLEVARVVLTSVRQAVLALAQKQQTIGRQFAVIDCEETIRALEFTHG